jgi:hypothetical protein
MVYDVENMKGITDVLPLYKQATLKGGDFQRATRNALDNVKTPILNTMYPAIGVTTALEGEEEAPELKKGGKNKKKIYIKPSKRGSLRKATGTSKGKNIPLSKLKDKPGDSKAMKKKKLFARNARKWKKGK